MDILLFTIRWTFVLMIPFLLGLCAVNYLVVPCQKRKRYGIISLVLIVVTAVSLGLFFRGLPLVMAGVIALASFIGAWLLMTRKILAREDNRPLPEIKRLVNDLGDGHCAVIYLTHGEPKHYDPVGWINTFRELDHDHVKFIPFIARPFFFHQLRQCYLSVGCSNHKDTHIKMLGKLEDAYRKHGDVTTRFYLCFLDDDPRPDAALIQALNEGASKIIVSLVFLTVSNHTAEGLHQIQSVGADKFGVSVKVTNPLWDSLKLREMMVQRVNDNLQGSLKTDVGVVLVGHGQPDEWDREFPTETEQEKRFRDEILKLFELDGYLRHNLGSAWMSFKEPKPAEFVEGMAKRGVKKVFYFACAISADSLHSQYDVPELMHRARISKDIQLVNLGAWNDDPMVIQAIKERIDQLLVET